MGSKLLKSSINNKGKINSIIPKLDEIIMSLKNKEVSKIEDIISGVGILAGFSRKLTTLEEYNRNLFFNNGFEGTIRQGDVGTCYFLSSLEMTKQNEKGRLNLLNMIGRVDNDGQISYNIKFPGEERVINITEKELSLIESKGYGLKGGTLGDNVISGAHMKYVYENSDLFKEKNIPFEEYIKNHERKRYEDLVFEAGQESEAIKLLWGKENVIVDYFYITKEGIGFNNGEMFFPPKGLAKVSKMISYDDLSKYIDEGAMIGFGTKRKRNLSTINDREAINQYKDFYGNKVDILGPHAYWVKNIDIKNGFIEVSEPFNSQKVMRFSLEQFNSIFNSITLVRQRK